MRDRGQMPTMQGRGQRPRGPHRIYGWKGWGTRESKREERTYPWDNGMREGRMREMGSWERGLRMLGKYTTYLRGYGVSTRQKRSRKPTQTVFFTCPCFTGEGTGVENYVRRKTVERTLKQWRNMLSVHQESNARVLAISLPRTHCSPNHMY